MALPRPRLGADVGAESLKVLEWLGAVVAAQRQGLLLVSNESRTVLLCHDLTSPTVSSAAGMLGLVLSSVTSNLTILSSSTFEYYQSVQARHEQELLSSSSCSNRESYRGYDGLQVRGQSRGGRGLGDQPHVDTQDVHQPDNTEKKQSKIKTILRSSEMLTCRAGPVCPGSSGLRLHTASG